MNTITQKEWDHTYKQLRPYQHDAVDFLISKERALHFDDMGLGKTVTTLSAALSFGIDKPEQSILIFCTVNALGVWKEELQKWFNRDVIQYTGTIPQRKKILPQIVNSPYKVVITTYGMIEELTDLHWDTIIADEIHQGAAGLLKHTNISYKKFVKLSSRTRRVYLLTGTPIRQGVIDLFAPLKIIAPETFSHYWSFVNKYCITLTTPFGKQIERNPRDIAGFRKVLDHYMIRRLKSEVLKDLPGKQRNIIPLHMTPKQAKAHDAIIEELYYSDRDTLIVTPNQMSAMLRARQLLVTPRLLGIDEDGAALNYLKEVGEALLFANRPFVVFTPFKQALPIIAEVVEEIYPGVSIHYIHGGMSLAAFANSWQSFESSKNKKKVMLCVIKSGASFHATEAADGFFLGYEWDFNLNAQAEDRMCRFGQTEFVNCNYLLHEGTVDEDVKNKINEKSDASDWIVGTEQQFQAMLKRVGGKRNG